MPEPEEAVLSQQPVAIADGDRGEDQGQGSTHNDEGPDEGFQEGPLGPPLGQQPLGLEDTTEGMSGRALLHPSNLFRENPCPCPQLPQALFSAAVSFETQNAHLCKSLPS